MKILEAFFNGIADRLWGDWLLYVLVGLGILYTLVTGFIQFKCVRLTARGLLGTARKKPVSDESKCSSYQALCTAVASCVGSGNIVGVSTAILAGGPGTLVWMWIAAFFGMATKFGEIVLGIRYHGYDENHNIVGGPMYYIAKGLRMKWAGVLVAILLFIQNAGGTLIQSNTISKVAEEAFSVPNLVVGIITAVVMLYIVSGGFKRLVHVAQKIVPVMAIFYIAGGFLILIANVEAIPEMLVTIFKSAFSLKAGTGALAGFTIRESMRYGVARGLYSNEAGEGSAAVLHASADVDHPVRQGLYGVIEVFIDTMVICSTTGFIILVTGVNQYHSNASTLAATAFGTVFPWLRYVVYVSLILFAGTSIMSQWYFGHVSLTYLKASKWQMIYRWLFPCLIVFGSMSSIDLVWSIQDCALGLLIIPNILTLIILVPEIRKLTKEFFNPANGYLSQKGDNHG